MSAIIEKIRSFSEEFIRQGEHLTFTMLEVGGVPLGGEAEPFHALLDIFPGSRVIAFELDRELCERLNAEARPGLEFFPVALGRTEETRTLYETVAPMCYSLYEPNERLLRLYQNFEVAYLKSTSQIDTVSLDAFAARHDVHSVDFVKIDVQGAELDIFEGGVNTLRDVVAMVCEVEFVEHYVGQPLFGDVCAFLKQQDIMYHKLLGAAGRALRPIVINNNPNTPSQHFWSDAVFIRDVLKVAELEPPKMLKMGVLAYLYGSPDLAYYCFQHYDQVKGTNLKVQVLA